MINFSIIQKSRLEGADRIDADYYQPEFLLISELLRKQKTETLENLSNFVKKGIFDLNPDNYRTSGVPFVRTTNIKDPLLNIEEIVFLESDTHQKNYSTSLHSGDLVFTKIGANIGDLSLLPSNYDEYNFSQNVAGLSIKRKVINSGYLFTYLLSKYGRGQIERRQMISGQGKLELKDLRNIQVVLPPKDFEKQVEKLIAESQSMKNLSIRLYKNAENLLFEELGFKDFKIPEDLSYIVNYSELVRVNRVDADYFQPMYAKLLEKLKINNVKKLGDLVSLKKGFETGSEAYQSDGKLFIRVSSLSKFGIEDKDQKYLSDDLYQKFKPDFEPKVGEILLTKDATPGISYVVKEPTEGIISGGILRLKLKRDIEPEYLSLCISSQIGQMQADRDAGGSIIVHWKPEQIKNILIPVLPKETQTKIADLVKKSHGARKKSKELLEEAKRKVEEMIEMNIQK